MKINAMDFFIKHLFFVVWLGAVAAHLFGYYRRSYIEISNTIKYLFPNWKDTTINRLDSILTPFLVAVLTYFLLQPSSIQSAILNGIFSHIALTSLIKGNPK